MAIPEDDRLLQAFKELQSRLTPTVEAIASDARSGGTLVTVVDAQGRLLLGVNVLDSSVSRSSGSIS